MTQRILKSSELLPRRKSAYKFLAAAAVFSVVMLLFYHCPFKMITGIDCPGCGLTRAFLCIFLGDISAAVMYHPASPLIFAQLVYILYYQFILLKNINKKIVIVCIFADVLFMAAFWLYKIF